MIFIDCWIGNPSLESWLLLVAVCSLEGMGIVMLMNKEAGLQYRDRPQLMIILIE